MIRKFSSGMGRAVVIASLAGAATGQSFNIDVGSSVGGPSAPIPSSFAACGQPGYWNEVMDVSPSGIFLRDLQGNLQAVIMSRPTTQNAVVPAGNADTGTFARLMADGIPVNTQNNSDKYAFTGMQPGRYLVYVYFANATSGVDAFISATGHPGASLAVEGGGLPNRFVAGGNYTVSLADVAADGKLEVLAARKAGGQANVAGMQLVKLDGARRVLHINPGASGDNSGSSWQNAMGGPIEAVQMLQAAYQNETETTSNTVDFDLWLHSGTYNVTYFTTPLFTDRDGALDIYDGTRIFGGFTGTETDPNQRTFAQGTATVISGEIGAPGLGDNSRHLLIMQYCSDRTVVDGVTFAYAWDERTTQGLADGRGAAVFAATTDTNDSTNGAVFRNSTFKVNGAARGGGAVYAQFADLTFENCVFDNNMIVPGNPASHGSAVHAPSSDLTIIGCDFIGNFNGHNVVNSTWGGNTTRILNSRFLGNTSTKATIASTGPMEIGNALVAGNYNGLNGAAIAATGEQADVTLANVTLAHNSAPSYSAGMLLSDGADAQVFNSIIWGNHAGLSTPGFEGEGSIDIVAGPTFIAFAHSTVENGNKLEVAFPASPFSNNTIDPEFIDITGPDNVLGNRDDNYQLALGSPAQDTGNISFAPSDDFDLDGDGQVFEEVPFDLAGASRIVDLNTVGNSGFDTIDRGAYETQPQPCAPDFRADGVLNIFDILDFFTAFGAAEPRADLTADGLHNIFDILAFFNLFGIGC